MLSSGSSREEAFSKRQGEPLSEGKPQGAGSMAAGLSLYPRAEQCGTRGNATFIQASVE